MVYGYSPVLERYFLRTLARVSATANPYHDRIVVHHVDGSTRMLYFDGTNFVLTDGQVVPRSFFKSVYDMLDQSSKMVGVQAVRARVV